MVYNLPYHLFPSYVLAYVLVQRQHLQVHMETRPFQYSDWSFYICDLKKDQSLNVTILAGISVYWEASFKFRVLIRLIISPELVSLKVKLASKPLLFAFAMLGWFLKYLSASLSGSLVLSSLNLKYSEF